MAKKFEVTLPKWPALTVGGWSVTKEQAAEIILRTTPQWMSSNNRPWVATVCRILGVPLDPHGTGPDWREVERFRTAIGAVPLSYLHNQQIMTSYVGGPHGWCHWDGTIATRNYNIGKWPTVEGVEADWLELAKAFPYLDLYCQLWDGETCNATKPLVQYRVKDGTVKVQAPRKAMKPPVFESGDIGFGTEPGCSSRCLEDAVEITRRALRARGTPEQRVTP